jgi:hypothetical protein
MAAKKLAPEIEALSDVLTALSALQTDDEKRWVLETASTRVGVALATGASVSATTAGGARTATNNSSLTPKEFMRSKEPKSDVQRIACLAYYLTNHRETAQFKSADLWALNTEAAGPKINMSRAVNNATAQNGYLASAGGGRKQITALGEDVANALPNQEAVKAVEEQVGKPKRKKKSASRKIVKK